MIFICTLSVLWENKRKWKIETWGSNWTWKKNPFSQQDNKAVCPRGLQKFHPWRLSRLAWRLQDLPSNLVWTQMLILLWAGSQAGRPLKVPSKINDYVINDYKASESIKMFLLLPLSDTCWNDASLPLSVQNEEQVLWPCSIFSSALFNVLSSS